MHTSYKKAFRAMFYVLDSQYSNKPSKNLGALLSDICTCVFSDGKSSDPAAYHDFVDCCKSAQPYDNLWDDPKTAFLCAVAYLNFYQNTFGYALDSVIKDFTYSKFEAAYKLSPHAE